MGRRESERKAEEDDERKKTSAQPCVKDIIENVKRCKE